MQPSANFNKRRQAGFTLVEIMFAILIVSLVLGTIVVQMSKLYASNKKNTSAISVNAVVANEVEKLKAAWNTTSNWTAGTYTPSPTTGTVTFSCASWGTNMSSPPTTFTSTCASLSGTTLKRTRLVGTVSGKSVTVYLDIAAP